MSQTFSRTNCTERIHDYSSWKYNEAGKRELEFQANFSERFEVLSSNEGSYLGFTSM